MRRQRTSDWPRSSRSRISVRLRWQPYVACIPTYTTLNTALRRFQEWTPVCTFGCLTDTHHGEDTSPFNTLYPHNARGNMRIQQCVYFWELLQPTVSGEVEPCALVWFDIWISTPSSDEGIQGPRHWQAKCVALDGCKYIDFCAWNENVSSLTIGPMEVHNHTNLVNMG